MTTGSLQEKAGKFYAVLHLGNGKYKWKCTGLTIKGNKKKAQIILDELISEYYSKKVVNVKKILFSAYIKNWKKAYHQILLNIIMPILEKPCKTL